MLPWILTGAAIAGGYISLWNGGTTFAAALLVAGYCALAPWAIVAGRRTEGSSNGKSAPQPPWLAAALAATAILALFITTLAPTTAMWDTSEYIAAAKVLGLPHPPGNPLFVLIAHLFGAIPLPIGFAARMNLLAAVSSACASALWFLVAYATFERMLPSRWTRIAASVATVIVAATAFTVWNQSVVNEKVYTVSLAQIALVTWLAVHWAQRAKEPGAERLMLLGAYLVALGYTVHPAGFLAAAPLGGAVIALRPRTLLRMRFVVAAVVLFAAGLTPFAYEPVRSAHDPAVNEGEPTACDAHIGVACTFSGETWKRLMSNVNREQYAKPSMFDRQAPFDAQAGMWWLYWRWQWFRDSHDVAPPIQLVLAIGALVLAAAGARAQWKYDRTGFFVLGALIATVTVALVFYLNFKYGWSEAADLRDAPREVRDRDYFFIWSFSTLGVWVGMGIVSAWRSLAARGGATTDATWRRTAPALAMALLPLALNWRDASRAGQRFTREWAWDLLQSAPPGAVLFTVGDNDTFPLWYAQQVEGIRTDVTVVIAEYLGLDWAPWQFARRKPTAYYREAGPPIWRDTRIPAPRPALAATRRELDAIPYYIHLDKPSLFVLGAIRARVDSGYVTRDQMLLLRTIQDSFPERPIMFTAPPLALSVGLGPYLARSGILWELTADSAAAVPGHVDTPGGLVDVPQSLKLWREVYRGPAQLARENDWVDASSLSSPATYAYAGSALAAALRKSGATSDADSVQRDVDAIVRASRLDRAGLAP